MKYPVLPVMQCDDNCGECCGFAPCTKQELTVIRGYVKQHGIEPIRQGARCPLYQNGRCSVHAVRPLVCRLFGHSERLVCCKGYNRNITKDYEQKINDQYGEPDYFTHDICYEPMEILGLFQAEVSQA